MKLSEKYRPLQFGDVLGQKESITVLKQILKTKDYPSALLFMGNWGSGKTTLARLFAMAELCQSRVGEDPCLKCSSCLDFLADKNLSFNEIDAGSSGSVSDVRKIIEESHYRAIGGNSRKIHLVDECHMLSQAAQNAYLKILESGSKNMLFLFCTTDPDKILPTMISRCIPFKIKDIPFTEIVVRLQSICEKESILAEEEALRLIVVSKRGHVRDCIMALDQLRYGGGVTVPAVKSALNLDLDTEYFRLLSLIEGDAKSMLSLLDSLVQRATVRDIYAGLSRVSLSVFKSTLGVHANLDAADISWTSRLATMMGARSLKVAEFLSSKMGLTSPISLECDLLALRHCWREGFPGESQLNLKKEEKKQFASELERIDYFGTKQRSNSSVEEPMTVFQVAEILGAKLKDRS